MQKVIPAILTADSADLAKKLEMLRELCKWVQIDIMDGKFVQNVSVNLFELGEVSQFFDLEIHLMVEHPEKYLEDCKAIGARRVIFHVEASENPARVLEDMEKYDFQKGIALNPSTPAEDVSRLVSRLDSILLLTVNPGFQGQEFIASALQKIEHLRDLPVGRQGSSILIGVDGGVREENIRKVFKAGADYVAVGSGIWKTENPAASFKELQEMVG